MLSCDGKVFEGGMHIKDTNNLSVAPCIACPCDNDYRFTVVIHRLHVGEMPPTFDGSAVAVSGEVENLRERGLP